jgi:hypothetical protein
MDVQSSWRKALLHRALVRPPEFLEALWALANKLVPLSSTGE